MSTESIRQRLTEVMRCGVLAVPALILMFASLIRHMTPVFDRLPSEFDAVARLVVTVAVVFTLLADRKGIKQISVIVLFAMTAVGLMLMLETGVTYVLDAALIILLLSSIDIKATSLTVFAFFACVGGATSILSLNGFFRVYHLYGLSTFGFRSLSGLFLTVALVMISLVGNCIILHREKKIKCLLLMSVFPVFVSALLIVLVLKAANLSAAVEPGNYQIYSRDTAAGIEVQMMGFDDYRIVLGEDEPTGFDIVPDGDNYLITMDSYGVTKTLCVIDDSLFAGNYEQSELAHEWSIEAVTGSPYFVITNVETGLRISAGDDGEVYLTSGKVTEADYLRVGSENIDYYRALSDEPEEQNDIRNAHITASSKVNYTGCSVVPSGVTVTLNGVVLQEGRDYELNCWNNYLVGTAWADITGVGDYTGMQSVPYEIVYSDSVLDDPFYRQTSDYVVRAYRMAFQRYPSIDEVRAYVQELIGFNRTPDSVVWDMYNNGGLRGSNAQLVEAIYRLMLLRNGSRSELANWIAELDGGATREDVINAISESPDYQNIWHSFGISYR